MAHLKPVEDPVSPPRAGRIALMGRPNVGKSTLLNTLIGEPIAITSHHPQTTRDAVMGVLTENRAQFVFTDTPGLHEARTKLGARMNQAARDAGRDADVLLFMTDLRRDSMAEMRRQDQALLSELMTDKSVVLALNKIDRLRDKRELLPVLERHAAAFPFAAIVPISARTGNGRANLLEALREHLPESPALFDDDTLSDKPVRFFVAEFVREQILRKTYQEVPHGVAVVVERFDESDAISRIDLAVHVDRPSHKGIIIGHGGSVLKAIGTDARARVEAMLGKHVHLQIWVRISPSWYEDEARLTEWGYGQGGEDSAP